MNDTDISLRDTVATWLRGQGHAPMVVPQDDRLATVYFHARERCLGVRTDEEDLCFLHIMLTAYLPEDVTDEVVGLRAAAFIEAHLKAVKIKITWETRIMTVGVEQYVSTPGGPDIFWLTVGVVVEALDDVLEALHEQTARAAATSFTKGLEAELVRGARPDAAPSGTEGVS